MDRLHAAEQLALDVVRRLEGDEPLSGILPAARRLAETWGQRDAAHWLYLEEAGFEAGKPPKGSAPSQDEVAGYLRFEKDRATIDVQGAAQRLPTRPGTQPTRDDRTHLLTASIAQTERIERPEKPEPYAGQESIRLWFTGELLYSESRRVVELVRTNVHRFASALHREITMQRVLVEIFGPDVFTVLGVGGDLLRELSNTPETLQRAGAYLAAQEARTTILRLGRELYRGPDIHRSPIDGSNHDTRLGEMNKIRAFLDDLWEHAIDPKRKALVEATMAEAEEAYELGSKAKDPSVITYAEALRAMQLTFSVARTIMLCGGFPVREPDPAAQGATPVDPRK